MMLQAQRSVRDCGTVQIQLSYSEEGPCNVHPKTNTRRLSGRMAIDGLSSISHEYICKERSRGRVSIDEWLLVVETKSRVGDWEVDTIIGHYHHQAIVSLVKRHSKFTLMKEGAQQTCRTREAGNP
jgi:hypothetical protein